MTVKELERRCLRVWAPPPDLSVSDWADRYRELSGESAAKQGRWRTKSFQREPFDSVSDPRISRVVIKACTQVMKTELILNSIGYFIDVDPGPILVLQPGQQDAEDFSKERIDPMIRDCSRLRAKVATEKSRTSGNTIGRKYFPGGLLAITHASSPRNVARRAIRFLFCDEIDKYLASAGKEGNPISLARKRMATFRHRAKEIDTCSPTVTGSEIDRAYSQSDQREFFVPCPACGHEQSLMRKFRTHVRWDNSLPTVEERAKTARYHCESCDAPWDDAMRWRAVEAGKWRAQSSFNGVAGFWISELYSPWKQLWEIVLDYLTKKDSVEDLKTFINTSLAENWEEPGEQLDWQTLVERREDYEVGTVPAGGLFLTASVDVQREDGGRLECRVNAYGENRERWAVDYRIFPGDPTDQKTWEPVEAMLHETWPNATGAELPIERMFVDSGDGAVTAAVYEWVRKQPRPKVWAIKGDRRSQQPVSSPREVETTTRGKRLKWGVLFKLVDSDHFKGQLLADLRRRPPTQDEIESGMGYPQGYFHMPKATEFGDEHCKQLCAERLVRAKKPHGRTADEYEKTRPRNEALDTAVYCDAAAWDFGANRFQSKHWAMLRAKVKAPEPLVTTPQPTPQPAPVREVSVGATRPRSESWFGDRSANWLRR